MAERTDRSPPDQLPGAEAGTNGLAGGDRKASISEHAQAELQELRTAALRLFLVIASVAYVAWHTINTLAWSQPHMIRVYAIAPVAALMLVLTYVLLPRNQTAASGVFIAGGVGATSWALYVLDTPQVALLYALVALVAAFVIHPLGGLLVVVGAAGILELFEVVRPGLIGSTDRWYAIAFAVLGVAGVWVLMRGLSLALSWYLESYARAERRTREAQEHRAQLVQALRQLDVAYYRLERANAALGIAWRAAEEAERSKSGLVASISHELRTPLNLIAGFSEMLLADAESYGGISLPAVYRGDANAIFRSAQHLLALVDDILDMAQADVRKLPLTLRGCPGISVAISRSVSYHCRYD
ncbi:MAG: hypothetical protein HYY04_13935 [Chloroflexi bacterium]|nr:hypothetical protein [Chloroflexota bacterium]